MKNIFWVVECRFEWESIDSWIAAGFGNSDKSLALEELERVKAEYDDELIFRLKKYEPVKAKKKPKKAKKLTEWKELTPYSVVDKVLINGKINEITVAQ